MKELQYLKGVGPKRIKLLNKLDIYSVEDLLYYFPKEYEERNITSISKLVDGEKMTIKVRIAGKPQELKPRRGLTITKIPVFDGTGYASLVWFNQPFKKDEFKQNNEYIFTGKVSIKFGEVQLLSPETQKKTGIVPIYRLTENLSPVIMRNIMMNALLEINEIDEIFTTSFREKYGLMEIHEALKQIHFPKDMVNLEKARKRLVFEELFLLQLGMYLKKTLNEKQEGISFQYDSRIDEFIYNLPFTMTNAQVKVWQQVKEDMSKGKVMNRLVLGDVGSGKTLIAILAALLAVYNGYQVAFMAPTEILAEQHYINIKKMLNGMSINITLLTGSITQRQKNNILEEINNGTSQIIIGTHALIQDNVGFCNLGLVITDEQHRFGVRQRALLSQKGINPDMLIMTATPIPRTLALVIYGDLDVSIIDEMPPGRKKVITYAVDDSMGKKVYEFVHKTVKSGRQAYVICPLIESSDVIEAKSAVDHYKYLKEHFFGDCRVELLHGKMTSDEKEQVMDKFVKNEVDVLVSTTVIEVGIDVPNASVIVIENAERFGLAQLHQLRGRVGRGEYQSFCFLITSLNSDIIRQRMDIMVKSQNGFTIAEKDMEIRGPGEILGMRQHGLPELKITDLKRDFEILKISREAVEHILKEDPTMDKQEHKNLKKLLKKKWAGRLDDIILN